jgi:branched-subunit amino acid aminotransferase/4-amino-4-deoxychorismate lyase
MSTPAAPALVNQPPTPPAGLVDFNGRIMPADEARISPLSPGFLFGHAVFETIRVLAGRPVFLPAHFERVSSSAATLGLETELNPEGLRRRIGDLAARSGLQDGNVKLLVFQDRNGVSDLLIARTHPYSAGHYARGFRLRALADTRTMGSPAHKTTNYLKNLLARQEAQAGGFDEALFVSSEGEVFEGATTNLFAITKGEAFTPPATHGLLPGVARRMVLERGTAILPVRVAPVTREMLATADEVFVTNALLGVMPVACIDQKAYTLANYRFVPQLIAAFREWQLASTALQ